MLPIATPAAIALIIWQRNVRKNRRKEKKRKKKNKEKEKRKLSETTKKRWDFAERTRTRFRTRIECDAHSFQPSKRTKPIWRPFPFCFNVQWRHSNERTQRQSLKQQKILQLKNLSKKKSILLWIVFSHDHRIFFVEQLIVLFNLCLQLFKLSLRASSRRCELHNVLTTIRFCHWENLVVDATRNMHRGRSSFSAPASNTAFISGE